MGKFSGEGKGELRTSIRDEGIVEAKAFKDIVEENLGNSCGVNSFGTRS